MGFAPDQFDILARKQKVGQADADTVALQLYMHLDAAKRGQGTNHAANQLATHLIAASYIAQQTKSRAFHTQITAAYNALKKASDRPTQLLDLTTGEYKQIRAAFNTYLKALPNVQLGTMHDSMLIAQERMKCPSAT